MEDLFEITGTKSLDSNAIDFVPNGINFIGRTFENNGIQGFIEKRDFEPNDPYTITATVIGNYKYAKYQKEPYYCSQNINKLTPKKSISRWNENIAYFFVAIVQQFVSLYDGQQGGYKLDDIKKHKIYLPVNKNNKIDFDFMESFIRELEEERIRELAAYLTVSGLADITLTATEEAALLQFDSLEWKEYRIGNLYSKVELNNQKFDKRRDTRNQFSPDFPLPVVNAKHGDNGIMFYGNESIFDSEEMTIDIVQNGAIATGDVYPQPQRTGVLWDAYLIKARNHKDSRLSLFFVACAIEKSIKKKFSYEFKAIWERVQNEYIYLPTKDGNPDYETIELFISAIQKLVIKDVVQYADQKIAATKLVTKKE